MGKIEEGDKLREKNREREEVNAQLNKIVKRGARKPKFCEDLVNTVGYLL